MDRAASQTQVNGVNYDFASKIEGTFYPQTNGVTTGVSNVDISLVDGFNFAINYYPTNGGICSSGKSGFVYYNQANPMSQVPVSGVNLQSICPANQQAENNGTTVGCLSSCTYNTSVYGASSPQAQQACCSGSYNTSATCRRYKANSLM